MSVSSAKNSDPEDIGAIRGHETDVAAILANTPFLLTRCSSDLRYLFVSEACGRMLRVRPEDVEGRPIIDIIGDEAFRTILPYVERVLRGEDVEYERDIHYAGVGPRRVRVRYTPDRDRSGNVRGWVASILDLTDQRKAEAHTVADLRATTILREMGNVRADECLQRPERGGSAKFDVSGRTNAVLPLELPASGVGGVVEQTAERGGAELAIAQSRRTFSELIERAPFGIYVVNADFRIAQMNLGSQEGAFRNVRPVIGRDFGEAMHILWPHEVAESIIAAFRQTLETGERYLSPLFINPRRDVSIVEAYEWELHRLVMPDGRYGVVCYYFDSTKLRMTEAALRESEERLRLALDGAELGSWDVDLKVGKMVWNRRHAEMQGYDPDTAPASIELWRERVHPDDKLRVEASFEKAGREHELFAEEHRYVHANTGEVRWVSLYGRFIYDEAGQPVRVSGVSLDVTEHKRAAERLKTISNELRQTLDITPTGITRCSRDLRFVSANRAYAVLVGKPTEEIVGRPMIEVLGRSAFTVIRPYVERVLAGETVEYEREAQFNGETHVINVTYVPDRDEHGQICGWVASVHDVTARRRSEERLRLVMREVNHRAKNMLALVQAVARQTAASSPQAFITRFSERIQALSAAQDLLVKNDWTGVGLDELIRSQLAHFKDVIGSRIFLQGPLITVTASAAQTLGMAFHELATNAGKYGALSTEKGRIDIVWDLERPEGAEARFVISWQESDGPPVKEPSRRGFGSTAIDAMTRMSLSCEPRIEFKRSGFAWLIECPTQTVLANSKPAVATRQAKSVESTTLGPARILVVEDEALLALEIAAALSDGGFEVVGPARTVAQALKLLAQQHCDAAVLDINLGEETAEAVAHRLAAANIPFVTVSGYSRDQQPAVFSHAPCLSKPFEYQRLLEELKRFVTRSHM